MNNSKEETVKQEINTEAEKRFIFAIEKSCFIKGAEWMQSEIQQRIEELEAQILDLEPKFTELEMECKMLKSELKRKDEALKSIRNLQIRSDIHPSLQGDKAIEIAQEVLKMDKDGK